VEYNNTQTTNKPVDQASAKDSFGKTEPEFYNPAMDGIIIASPTEGSMKALVVGRGLFSFDSLCLVPALEREPKYYGEIEDITTGFTYNTAFIFQANLNEVSPSVFENLVRFYVPEKTLNKVRTGVKNFYWGKDFPKEYGPERELLRGKEFGDAKRELEGIARFLLKQY